MQQIQAPAAVEKPKRAAVVLFGIHHRPAFKHWMGWAVDVDFRRSVPCYQQHIFNHLKGYEVDVFMSTYESPIISELYKAFDPELCKVTPFIDDGKDQIRRRNARFSEAVSLARAYETSLGFEYDLTIITRFDLDLFQGINSFKYLPGKLNVLYSAKCGDDHDLVDDNFYMLTAGGLEKLDKLNKFYPDNVWYHELHKHCGDFEVHRMFPGAFYSHESQIYGFIRTQVDASKVNSQVK